MNIAVPVVFAVILGLNILSIVALFLFISYLNMLGAVNEAQAVNLDRKGYIKVWLIASSNLKVPWSSIRKTADGKYWYSIDVWRKRKQFIIVLISLQVILTAVLIGLYFKENN